MGAAEAGGTATYLYAVAEAVPDVDDLTGVAGAPVRTVESDDARRLVAVVSSVDAEAFDEQALRRNFEDLQWLEAAARAHHAVVAAAAGAGPVAPVRLATVYHSDERVAALLAERADEFAAVLDAVRGRSELGVKAYAAAQASPAEPAPDTDRPGTAYLRQRQQQRQQAAGALERATAAAEALHAALSARAHAARRYPPQDPRLSGEREEMVLNAAYLVDDAGAAALRAELDRSADPALRIEATGPWAPYSFATLEQR